MFAGKGFQLCMVFLFADDIQFPFILERVQQGIEFVEDCIAVLSNALRYTAVDLCPDFVAHDSGWGTDTHYFFAGIQRAKQDGIYAFLQ